MPIRKKVTLQHLATELGLTVHTVSKALRGLPGMSEYTRNEVLLLAHKLGYHTKEQERSLLFENTPVYSGQSRRFIFLIAARQGLQSPLHHVLLESVPPAGRGRPQGRTIICPGRASAGKSLHTMGEQT
ncbi:hypothetical protein [Paenibacillus graminis]|uniref:helix-turn-helix domain-containing protein n=1 Tax=Paenibacillus graminis TaxID=189425 RepID=UPI0030C9E508